MVAKVHELIVERGIEEARAIASTKHDRACVDIAAAMLADETGEIGISHSGFALTSLPHKQIHQPLWIKDGHKITLHVESGRDPGGEYLGVPYGSKARMILLYLQTEALRSNSAEVELGRSMRAWMTRMGLKTGGATYKLITEQSKRISGCRLTFFRDVGTDEKARLNAQFVDAEIPMHTMRDGDQMSLWQETVHLNDRFFQSLKDHAVPLRDEALRQLSSKSLSLDLYIWLAYRLHILERPMKISWPALYAQFGSGYRHVRQFKPKFKEALGYAMAAYEGANILVEEHGLVLHPSRAPVEKRLVAIK